MKSTSLFAISGALLMAVLLPSTSQALSCVDPASMLQYYVDEPSYVVFTGLAGETVEHVKQAADPEGSDPNLQFNSGYTAQRVTPMQVYKGDIASDGWVYHQRDATWNYLCSSGPVTEGQEALFIVSDRGEQFGLIEVVNTYPVDSELATDIITAVGNAEGEPRIYEVTKESRLRDLGYELREMIYLIRIKLAEWRWWSTV